MQGIRAADGVVYLKARITQQVGAPGSPGGRENQSKKPWITLCVFETTNHFSTHCNHEP